MIVTATGKLRITVNVAFSGIPSFDIQVSDIDGRLPLQIYLVRSRPGFIPPEDAIDHCCRGIVAVYPTTLPRSYIACNRAVGNRR